MAPDRERGVSPMGRIALPAVVMNVKLCCTKCEEKAKEECEEVEGVVKVVADMNANKVIAYGTADPPALLKKMRRHLDKHAMYWPMDESNQAPPVFPVDPVVLPSQIPAPGLERNAGVPPPLQTGPAPVPVDPRGGRAREVRQMERELAAVDAEIRDRAAAGRVPPPGVGVVPREVMSHGPEQLGGGPPPVFVPVDVRNVEPVRAVDARDMVRPVERMELRGDHHHGPVQGPGGAPREVVFIPVDAKDGTPVDPRRVYQVDPRDERPMGGPPHGRPGPGPDQLREVRIVHDSRDPPVTELREVRPVDHHVRDPPGRVVPVDVASDLRPLDPHNMMSRHGDQVHRMDPHVVRRTSEPRDDNLRSVDPRLVRPIDHPRDGWRGLDPREMADLRDGRGAAPSGVVPPEGLVPVRTGRDSRDVHFAPGSHLSPTHGPRDMGPRSPPNSEYMSRSPRQSDYGPRSPREEYGAPNSRDYTRAGYGPPSPRFEAARNYAGPRSPRGGSAHVDYDPGRQGAPPPMHPVLDRELSFNEFAQGGGASSAMDQGRATGGVVPMPYEPVNARDAAAFDFHGGGGGGGGSHPRSPRSGGHLGPAPGTDHPSMVRGYGDIDPRQFASEPSRVMRDGVNADIRYNDSRDHYIRDQDDVNLMNSRRDGGLDRSPRRHSQYSEFRNGEGDVPLDYQPKESYFSNYQPSQSYPSRPSGHAAY